MIMSIRCLLHWLLCTSSTFIGVISFKFTSTRNFGTTSQQTRLSMIDTRIGSMLTLSRFMIEEARSNPELQELESLMTSIQIASKTISELIARAGTIDLCGNTVSISTNTSNLYDAASMVLKNSLRFTGKLGILTVSEEDRNPILIEEDWNSNYIAVFDPLDGAMNIDVGVVTGTIFSVYRETFSDCLIEYGETVRSKDVKERLLKNLDNKNLIAAGYIMYSSQTVLLLTLGNGVYGFTLDLRIGEFVLTSANVKIPKRGRIYSFNEANYFKWPKSLQKYVTDIKQSKSEQRLSYTARYIGSLVGDIHRTLYYGGIFAYPADTKRPKGKLSLLSEVSPMAYIIEQAGGKASTGYQRILSIKPQTLDETVGCFMGSYDDVSEVERYLATETDW